MRSRMRISFSLELKMQTRRFQSGLDATIAYVEVHFSSKLCLLTIGKSTKQPVADDLRWNETKKRRTKQVLEQLISWSIRQYSTSLIMQHVHWTKFYSDFQSLQANTSWTNRTFLFNEYVFCIFVFIFKIDLYLPWFSVLSNAQINIFI